MHIEMGRKDRCNGGVLLETHLEELFHLAMGFQHVLPCGSNSLCHPSLLYSGSTVLTNLSELTEYLAHDGTEHKKSLSWLDFSATCHILRPDVVKGGNHELDKGARPLE
jgi:hypothetical protein